MCSSGCTGITATGVDVRGTIYHEERRVVAVDPNVIPLGTHLTITFSNGNTVKAIAEDTGGAIKGNRIDILMSGIDEARSFGRQNVKVQIH